MEPLQAETIRDLLELQRMERVLARAELERPSFLLPTESRQLRYLLGFARLTGRLLEPVAWETEPGR
jgi:hypothetical protein